MGVSLETYRQRIGCFHGGQGQSKESHESCEGYLLLLTLPISVIKDLLVMDGVEPHPGPFDNKKVVVQFSMYMD